MIREEGHPVLAHTLDFAMRGMLPVRKRIVPWAQGRVLEIGCGTGANFPFYPPLDALTAIEPDPHMRRQAQKAAENVAFPMDIQAHSAHALPFESGSFDTVVATFVLCTIPDPVRAAQEMCRVLAPEGLLIFAEHVHSNARWTQRVQRRVTPLWSRLAGGCRLDNDALSQLQEAGFALEVQSPPRSALHMMPIVYGFGRKGVLHRGG